MTWTFLGDGVPISWESIGKVPNEFIPYSQPVSFIYGNSEYKLITDSLITVYDNGHAEAGSIQIQGAITPTSGKYYGATMMWITN